MLKSRAMKIILEIITIMKLRAFWRKFLLKKNKNNPKLLTTINNTNIKILMKKLSPTTWWPKSKIFRKINPNLKILKTWKTSTQKQLLKNSNSIKNLPPITTTKDGSGCNSPGSVWPWSATIPISSENVSPHPPPTCQSGKKDNSPAVTFYLFRSIKDCFIG